MEVRFIKEKLFTLGYGCCIVAETNKGCVWTNEVVCTEENKSEFGADFVPEDLGRKAAYALLEEIFKGIYLLLMNIF